MLGIGIPELVVIFLVIFLLFGAKALPEIAKSLGQAMKVLKREARELREGFESEPLASPPSKTENQNSTAQGTSHEFKPNDQKRDWRPKSHTPSEKS